MTSGAIFILFIFIAHTVRLAAIAKDTDRLDEYIRNQGGKMISKDWGPFGKVWAYYKSERNYRVTYKDKDGHLHEAFVMTSSWSGVYFAEDKIIEYNKEMLSDTGLGTAEKEELERLRKENEVLRNQLNQSHGG